MDRIRWGVLSTAKIAREKVIPAMQAGMYCEMVAIASRNIEVAGECAQKLNIRKYYGTYEELLSDREVQAVYIPLPNHLHVSWVIKAIESGKHVLCEKPIAMNSQEAQKLRDLAGRHPELKVMEAFMYRYHPQWITTRSIIDQGGIGDLRTVQSFFSYYNTDPANIRNIPEAGGGSMMDIGCYCISLARYLFAREPQRVFGIADQDPVFKTDRMFSGIMDFTTGTATFTCSTQLQPFQRVVILGTRGGIEIEIPFNAPPDRECVLYHLQGQERKVISLPPSNQYTLQGDAFSLAILENTAIPVNLDDALVNLQWLELLLESGRQHKWLPQQ